MNKKRIVSVILALLMALSTVCVAASADSAPNVLINEVCSSNDGKNGNLTEITDYNDEYLDWVELYNPTDSEIDIGGFGLSSKKDVIQYTFAENTVISPKSFMIVYCSKDAKNDGTYTVAPFNISAKGETIYLKDSLGNSLDKVKVPAIAKDTTYSRKPDGSDKLYNTMPTPNESNNDAQVIYNAPIFSVKSGVYADGFDLELTNDNDEALDIYYTTDGSDPKTSATAVKYTDKIAVKDRNGEPNVVSAVEPYTFSPIKYPLGTPSDDEVDKATVIRACAKDADGNASTSAAATYFVGDRFAQYGKIALVSISTDYDNLFDYDTGIYTKGKHYDEYKASHPDEEDYYFTEGNYSLKGSEWKRLCQFDYIDENGECGISQECGLSIQGAVSRSAIQKSLRLSAGSTYGKSEFSYPIFDDEYTAEGKQTKKFKSLVLRNGGNDDSGMKFSDSFNQSLVRDMNFDTQSSKPCYVFLNGEYWGTYSLNTDYSADYIEEKYDVDADDVIMYKNWKWEEGDDADSHYLWAAKNFICNYSMAVDSNYEQAKNFIDMDSFIDYMAAQIYICNSDWPQGNFALWRTRYADESKPYADRKWRFMMFDTDLSTNYYNGKDKAPDYNKIQSVLSMKNNFIADMFQSLCKNEQFKRTFAKRFAYMADTNFNGDTVPSNLREYYKDSENGIQKRLEKNWERYNFSSINRSNARYAEMRDFYAVRPIYAVKQVTDALSLGDIYKVHISSTEGGKITVDGNEVESLSDYFFSTDSIKITAAANEGYYFSGFEVTGTEDFDAVGKDISFNPNSNMTVKAIFVQGVEPTTVPTTAAPTTSEPTTVIPSPTEPTSSEPPTPTVLYGDANGNGFITASDVLLIRKHISGQKVAIDEKASDVNDDSKITVNDVLLIRKYIAGQNITLGPKDSDKEDESTITGEKSYEQTMQFVQQIKCGWNLGNTLEAISIWGKSVLPENYTVTDLETGWGNPKTTKTMFMTVKDAGFNAVRIPVSWCRFVKEENGKYIIDEAWLERVKEVVDYAYTQDMYVIMNMHHDDKDWLDISVGDEEWGKIKDKYRQIWTQIADYFKKYDEKLIFEGSNEIVRFKGYDSNGGKVYDWSGNDADYARVNEIHQVFVDTVRGTGGNNADRYLMIPTYGAQFSMGHLGAIEIPNDDKRVIVDMHWYYAGSDTNSLTQKFKSIYNYARVFKIPVVMGECGIRNAADESEKIAWTKSYVRIASNYGIRCFIWDDGGDFSVMDRRAKEWYSDNFVKSLVDNAIPFKQDGV